MFIKCLIIKNFRCFGKGVDDQGIKIDLDDGLTAFIGKNGSGKTAILEAINFLFGQDYLVNKVSEKDFNAEAKDVKDEILFEGTTKVPFFYEVDVITETSQPAVIIVPCKAVRLTIKRRQKADRVLDDPFIITKTVIPFTGEINDSVFEGSTFNKAYYNISSLEKIDERVLDLDSAKEFIKVLQLGQSINIEGLEGYYKVKFKLKSGEVRNTSFPAYSLGFNLNRIKGLAKSYYLTTNRDNDVSGDYSLISKILTDLHWKYKREECKGNGASVQQEYNTLASSLRNIVDEKGKLIEKINQKVKSICCDNKDFQIDFIDTEQPYKSAFLAKKEGDKLLIPANLGSGFNILIAYALFSYVVEKEKIPIVLIIDEPELHLHSDWQKKMYEIFTEQQELQIIYSTQSENFISIKNWPQIRLASDSQIYPQKEILEEQIMSSDGKSEPRGKYLEDYAKRNLHISTILRENLELFFTKKCILVEGPAEKYGLPILLNLSDCDIENYSVSIIPVWGKTKIKIYQMICRVFSIDYFTIFDVDKVSNDEPANENGDIEFNSQAGKVVKFSTSFEEKLGVTGDNKFQKLVKKIDELTDINSVHQEIKDCVNSLKTFIEG